MSMWMRPESALLRVVEDENAGVMARVRALEAVEHPPLILLRKLLWQPKVPRKKPIPSKLAAVAAFKYKQEFELRRIRRAQRSKAKQTSDNPLGII